MIHPISSTSPFYGRKTPNDSNSDIIQAPPTKPRIIIETDQTATHSVEKRQIWQILVDDSRQGHISFLHDRETRSDIIGSTRIPPPMMTKPRTRCLQHFRQTLHNRFLFIASIFYAMRYRFRFPPELLLSLHFSTGDANCDKRGKIAGQLYETIFFFDCGP